MIQDPTFALFHKYRRLVRRGQALPLACRCGIPYMMTLGADEQLELHCYGCDSNVVPGTKMIDRVESVVKEYFD